VAPYPASFDTGRIPPHQRLQLLYQGTLFLNIASSPSLTPNSLSFKLFSPPLWSRAVFLLVPPSTRTLSFPGAFTPLPLLLPPSSPFDGSSTCSRVLQPESPASYITFFPDFFLFLCRGLLNGTLDSPPQSVPSGFFFPLRSRLSRSSPPRRLCQTYFANPFPVVADYGYPFPEKVWMGFSFALTPSLLVKFFLFPP